MTIETQVDWKEPVTIVPLNQAFPAFHDVKEYRHKQCIFNADRSKLFNVVSRKYQVVQHADVVNAMTESIEVAFGDTPEVDVRSLAGGARIRAEFKMPWIKPIEVKKEDFVDMRAVLFNAHDGMYKLGMHIGAWRLLCSNGMMIGEKFGSISSKHFPSLAKPDVLAERIKTLMDRSAKLKDVWKSWTETAMKFEEAEKILLPNFPHKYLRPVLEPTRFPRSKWDLYNDLTSFATHQTKSVNRRIEFDHVISRLFYRDLAAPTEELQTATQ